MKKLIGYAEEKLKEIRYVIHRASALYKFCRCAIY